MNEASDARTKREVAIDDRLWELLETMSREMATPVDVLLGQAIFTFGRFNGYLGQIRRAATRDASDPFQTAGPPGAASGGSAFLAGGPFGARGGIDPFTPAPGAGGPPPLRAAKQSGAALVLEDATGRAVAVESDRFLIGRGRHCQLVIDSTQISREHAAIVREGDGWFIEDLGSSNGTWFEKERIARRRIADGDEFFVCAERLRCTVR